MGIGWIILICFGLCVISFWAGFLLGDHINKAIYEEAKRYEELGNKHFDEAKEALSKAIERYEQSVKNLEEGERLCMVFSDERKALEKNWDPEEMLNAYVEEHLEENGL